MLNLATHLGRIFRDTVAGNLSGTEFARLENNWRARTSGSTRVGTNFSKSYGAQLNTFSSSFEFGFVHRVRVIQTQRLESKIFRCSRHIFVAATGTIHNDDLVGGHFRRDLGNVSDGMRSFEGRNNSFGFG
jgi:hypothetical protein